MEVFHVELRQFPGQARKFNLSAEELERLVLARWRRGEAVVVDERGYAPGKARLRILQGPALKPQEIGLGRGWQNAQRSGRDVTEQLLARVPPRAARASVEAEPLEVLKAALLAACRSEPLALGSVVSLARRACGGRASACLALAERAVWELLQQGALRLVKAPGGQPRQAAQALPSQSWAQVLADWESWGGPPADQPMVLA